MIMMRFVSIAVVTAVAVAQEQQDARSSVSWGYIVTTLADEYINPNGLVRTSLNIKKGDLFRLYIQDRDREMNRNEHEVLLLSETEATKNYINEVISSKYCDDDTGCLPSKFWTFSESFFGWCSDVRNGRVRTETLNDKSQLGIMLNMYVDVHNPMHVAYLNDKGGSNCRLNVSDHINYSLRDLWDHTMIEGILDPNDIQNNKTKAANAVEIMRSFLEANYAKIQQAGALSTFEDIFSPEQYADMIATWSLITHNVTKECYRFATLSSDVEFIRTPSCGKSNFVDVDQAYLDESKYLLQFQLCTAGIRLAYLLNHAASAALTNNLNLTYSLIWTIILCGTFLCGIVVWAIMYPRLKRSFNRRSTSDHYYYPFDEEDDDDDDDDDINGRDIDIDSVFSAES